MKSPRSTRRKKSSPRQLAALHAQVQENWYQFLKAELLTSFTAIDFGHTEFDLGSREVAEKEIHAAEKGFDTIVRFLPRLDSEERRNEIGADLSFLLEAMKALRNKLEPVT